VHVVTNRRQGKNREYVTHLLRRSYREDGRVKNETVGNISHLPPEVIELVKLALRGEKLISVDQDFRVERSVPHGHIACVLAVMRQLDIPRLLSRTPSTKRSLCLAMIAQRVISGKSKLRTVHLIGQSTLAEELSLPNLDQDDLYAGLDWLLDRQEGIERRLAGRHLRDVDHCLYDLSSSYFYGKTCPLAKRGYSRDKRRGSLQVNYGLVCDPEGRPVAIEAFDGNTLDHQTLLSAAGKLRDKLKLKRTILCFDRGMVSEDNLKRLRESGIEWITAMRAPQLQKLVKKKAFQPSLFDEQDLAEIESEDYPQERLVVCRNPLVAGERRHKRHSMLEATERELVPIQNRVGTGVLQGKDLIGIAVGQVINRFKMKKHFVLTIEDDSFSFVRDEDSIAREAALDGIYILRTSASKEALTKEDTVVDYKHLTRVERAFRSFKAPEINVRPIHHRLADRVKAHLLLCMLAYYVEYQMRQAWREITFADECVPGRTDPVAKKERSDEATRKARTKKNADKLQVMSFKSVIDEMGLITRNTLRIASTGATFERTTEPTPFQARAAELVGAKLT
jgi:transposase